MALAKTTRPSVQGVLPRTRLFRLLDRGRPRPVTWVWGPPGAGKTTLIASYLAARKLAGFWYQVDAGDADVASFFYYLREAASRAAPRRKQTLPFLTPEYLPDLTAFARNFFRELYSRLKIPFVVVFDEYQEVRAGSDFHEVVREALAQVPGGGRVILVSRSLPPPTLARSRAGQAMQVLGWDDLRMTASEAGGLVQRLAPGRLGRDLIRAFHEKAHGSGRPGSS